MSIRPKGLFLGFGISITIKMSSNPKKWIPMLFAIKSSFKFPALAASNGVDHVLKDWWRMTSLEEHHKATCFHFACLTTAQFRQTSVCLSFCRGKLLTTTETTVTWARRISWFYRCRHDQFRNPDPLLHWITVNFIGRGWSENFKAKS